MTETIGTARLDIVVDTAKMEAGVDTAIRKTREYDNTSQQSTQKQEQNSRRQVASLEKQIATFGKSRDEVIRWRIEQQTSGTVAAQLTAKLDAQVIAARKGAVAFNQYGLSAKQQAAALRQVPAQVTDIFTSLASGQRPLTVLLQQGGQLKDVFGGAVPAMRAMGGALAGLINPITITLAAVGGLAVAWKQGADEAHAFGRAITLTGNFAGTTTQQLQAMSAQLSSSNVTQGQAAEALALVTSTGKFTEEQLRAVTEAALQMQVATGKAVEDTVAEFAKLADDPVKAVVELNSKYHFLTASVYDQIKALQAQGREQEAATLAIEEFGRVSADRARQAAADADWITKAWRGVKHGITDAFDSLRNFGRLQSEVGKAQFEIAEAREQLLTIEGRLRGEADDGTATLPRVDAYKKRIDQLKKIIADGQRVLAGDPGLAAAARRSQQQQANDALIQVREITDSHASAEEKRGKRIAREIGLADEAIKKARATGNADLIKQAESARSALAAAHAREAKQETTAPRTSVGGRSTSRSSAARALPDFAAKAEEELARLAQAEARATESFRDMEAQLQGPMAVALRDHQQRVAELNALAAQSPEAASRLSEALELEAKRHAEVTREIEAQSDPLRLLLDDMKFELDMIGRSNAERAVMIELRRLNKDAMSAEGQEALAMARAFDEEAQSKQRSIDAMDGFRANAADALADIALDFDNAGEHARDFFDNLGEMITRFIAEQWITGAFGAQGTTGQGTAGGGWLSSIFGALFGGGASGGSAGSVADLFSGSWGFAKGAAFAGGNVIPFANGGVVDSPTNFPMGGGRLGLMGEAGPEAIMPLARGSDGKLGVRMEGGRSVSLQQNFYVQGAPNSQTREQMARSSGREARRGMARTGG